MRTVSRLTKAASGRASNAAMHTTRRSTCFSAPRAAQHLGGLSVWPHLDQTDAEHKAGHTQEQGGEGVARPNFVADGADGYAHDNGSSCGDHTCSGGEAAAAVEFIDGLLLSRAALTSDVGLVLSQVDVLPDVVDQGCRGVRTKESQEKLWSRQRELQSVGC